MKTPAIKSTLFALILYLTLCTTGCADDLYHPSGLTALTSWSDIRTTAIAQQLPIVLLVEQRNCGFCQALKRDVIKPLASDEVYAKKAIFVSVLTDFDAPLIEIDGNQISGFDFAQGYNATTTPTILFLGTSAEEIQKRIVGYEATANYVEKLKKIVTKANLEYSEP